MSESMKIPYNTWGGVPQSKTGQASRGLTINNGEVPYNYSPLTSNLYISSDLTDKRPILYIDNMSYYARNNIPNYGSITSIPEEHSPNSINTSLAQNWSNAFFDSGKLENFPDPFYNTSNAIDMSNMFNFCGGFYDYEGVTSIPNFNTSNVINMSHMFNCCNRLLLVPNFDTSNVINMSHMFDSCRNLTTVPNFNTSNVTDMNCMFDDCYNLVTIPNFNTSNVTDMVATFRSCYDLTTVPNFDTSNVTNMWGMFNGCSTLITVPNFDTSNVTETENMFSGCRNLTTMPNFNLTNVYSMANMFYNCTNLSIIPNFINLVGLDNSTSWSQNAVNVFFNCKNLKSIPIMKLPDSCNISHMFENCSNIQGDLYLTSKNLSAYGIFSGCRNFTKNIYLHLYSNTYYNGFNSYRNFDQLYTDINAYIRPIQYYYAEIPFTGEGNYVFPANKIQIINDIDNSQQVIDISPYKEYYLHYGEINNNSYYIYHESKNWKIKINDYSNMKFRFFANIESMNSNIVDLMQIEDMVNFAKSRINNYSNINSIPLQYSPENLDTSLAKNWNGAFSSCYNLINLPEPFYNTSNAIDMSNMFHYSNNLITIPNFDTSNVTNMSYMFYCCNNLTTVPNFNTSSVIDMSGMFGYCTNLTVPNFDTSNVTSMYCMFVASSNITVPNFNITKASVSHMFDNASNITVPNFDTSNKINLSYMFFRCSNITVPNFDTSNVTNMDSMFYLCNNVTVPNFNTSKVTSMDSMFGSSNNVTVPNFDTSNVTNMQRIFQSSNLTIPNFNTGNVTDMSYMFIGSNNYTTIPIFNTSSVVTIASMFANCYNIQGNLYIESNNVTNAINLFGLNRYSSSNHVKNIYCHTNTTTYNSIYTAIYNSTYGSRWNAYLLTMEDNYAVIPYTNNGIYRFPTNKIQLLAYDPANINTSYINSNTVEVSPYTDYELTFENTGNSSPIIVKHGTVNWGIFTNITTGSGDIAFGFRFFKDITNMTAHVVDLL